MFEFGFQLVPALMPLGGIAAAISTALPQSASIVDQLSADARALVDASENRSIEVVAKRLSEAARRTPAAAQNILGLRDALVNAKMPDHAVTIDGQPKADPAEAPASVGYREPNHFDQYDDEVQP